MRESRPCPKHSSRTSDRGSRPSPRAGSSSTCATPSGGSRRAGARGAPSRTSTATRRSSSPSSGSTSPSWSPGQTSLYHAEENQEAFLVLSGECALLVEDEERRLRPWDFFHAPPWTEHAFVGAGEGPCVILMVGSRSGPGVHYPVSELAARYGASVAEETSDWRQAYATVERSGESGRRTGLVCPGRRFLRALLRTGR